jgi:hypothetical protein
MQVLLELNRPDLGADPGASWYLKDERVTVEFATTDDAPQSAVGQNRYSVGDALVTGYGIMTP